MSDQLTVEQMNEVIAVFEGYRVYDEGLTRCVVNEHGLGFPIRDLRYNESWKWLMPVIEKISKIHLLNHDNTVCTHPQDTCYPITFNMPTEDGKQVMFRFKGFSVHTADKLIDAAYAAVYEVVEYHNTQKEKQ